MTVSSKPRSRRRAIHRLPLALWQCAPREVNTLLLTAEDGVADTIRPRLDDLADDVTRIHHLGVLRAGDSERAVQLADVPVIEQR